MQTGTTEKPRLGYAKGGKIQCMADGGLVQQIKAGVNRLVGNNPGAMSARGRSEEQDAPAPTSSTTAPINKAKGGTIPAPPKGAAPHPDATGTDTVPIMGTPGEFMVRKPAVDKIEEMAPGLLDALNAMGDDKPKLGKVKRKRRGKRKPMQMGGPVVDDAQFVRPARAPQMLANQSNPTNAAMVANGRNPAYPQGLGHRGTAMVPYSPPPPNFTVPQGTPQRPALAAPTPGTAVATTPPRPNFTMPQQFAQPPAAPPALPAPPAKPLPQVDVQRQSWQGRTGSPQAEEWLKGRAAAQAPAAAPTAPSSPTPAAKPAMAPTLGKVARIAGPAGGVAAAIPEALDTATVAMNPNTSGIDVATQAAQGLGRIGAAGVGAAGGAALGAMTGPLAPVAVPLGAIAGGAYGYYAADQAIKGGRFAVGADPRAPVDQIPAAAPPAPAPMPAVAPASTPALGRVTAGAPVIDPRSLTNPSAAPGIVAPAQVVRTGNSYSGAPGITGDIQITDQAGTPRRMGGGVSVVPGAPGGAAPSGGSDAALFEARKAAIARGDVSSVAASYGGNFGQKVDPIDALINNGKPMTARKAAAIAQLQAARAQSENAATDRTVATTKAGAERESIELTNREKRAIVSAQEAYAAAKTPAERAEAEQRLRAVQGKYEKEIPNRFTVVPGGQEIGADGVPFTRPASVINNQTGEWVPQPQSRATTATPRAQYDAMKKGDVYIGTDGKQYIKG